MKTIEEKAEAYKDALERAKNVHKYSSDLAEIKRMEYIFPELAESEDEKIRKEIRQLIQGMHDADPRKERWLTWLEKQGEQQHAWSEEDINKPNGGIVMEDFNDGNGFYKVNLAYLNEEQVEQIEELVKRWGLQPKEDEDESIVSDLLDYFDEDKCLKHEVNDIVKWLKTIKPQQKGWGENEIKMLDNLITYLDGRKDLLEEIKRTYINFLKSLKQRMGWKPSDKQMKALHDMNLTGNISYAGQGQTLIELYNDLKKL